jgi:hypothetical protein
MSRSDRTAGQRQRRFFLGMDIAVGAGFVAAMIALAQTARADTDIDPFQDLFGDTGINTWTPAADNFLASIDPTGTLAANMDTSVDGFETLANSSHGDDAALSILAYQSDPGAFSNVPEFSDWLFSNCGGVFVACDFFPADANGDFAWGLDYTLFASGLSPTVDPLISDLAQLSQLPQELLAFLVILGIPLGI